MASTLKQIAEVANVSRGTVDRVIHGRYGVDPKTRARVLAVMQELDYKPNAMAQALRGMQNAFRIGAIVPSEANPFYIDVNSGIDEASKMAATYGMEVIKLTMDHVTVEDQIGCIDRLESENVCGIMLVPIEDQRIRERINRLPESIPVITFNSDISGTKRMCFVGNDHMAKAKEYGISPSRIHIDPLVEMLCTSENGIETNTEVISTVRERYPDIHITAAVSNISFNLPVRKMINLGFTVLAMNAGLDSAILDPTNRDMMGLIYATEALLGLDDYCMEYISAYREGLFGPVK